ncbi:MAG TPA: bifunctional DNA-formamidopyrimidine glycosylase/DNA-(apurinic or apyrimidinic site) lyase [Pyrinomonadaceae bacterium]|nr:bifunctional DNA-formamidopyrimidine glycosylase/DNA-(apurinic or apyrimidinic site) lyase [Pyrinomonadaceae bacterium]
MPELPEVEHVVRALRVVVGRTIIASEVHLPKLIAPLTASQFNRKIEGASITDVSRRGKFILIECQKPARKRGQHARSDDLIIAVHLRMTGKFLYLNADDDLPKHSHAIFYLDNDRRLVFRDQRQFGVMKLISASDLPQTKGISELAPEPFGDEFNFDYFKSVLQRSQRSLKTLLLDQTKVLGLGNIYAAEALFRARISPFKNASELSSQRAARLHQSIVEVLRDAITDSSTSRIDLEQPDGFSYGEAFERFWDVYEREGEPCVKCGTKIRRVAHGGRSTYWCPKCQRR